MILRSASAAFAFVCLSGTAAAGDAVVVAAAARWLGADRARIDVTIRHGDTGWDHYADQWTVATPGGEVLGVRTLYHPHVEEQPFTRSLTLDIPAGVDAVAIRARDSGHGESAKTFPLTLPPR
mgnify:CR=1 FL=1